VWSGYIAVGAVPGIANEDEDEESESERSGEVGDETVGGIAR
jgi:hypothetical protein